jgi:hypothetical protein
MIIGTKEEGKMERYLIEVPHEPEKYACNRAIEIFLKSGSHFLTHADWGCHDGEHKAWITVEVNNKEEARSILPPAFRAQAKITAINRFNLKDMEDALKYHT